MSQHRINWYTEHAELCRLPVDISLFFDSSNKSSMVSSDTMSSCSARGGAAVLRHGSRLFLRRSVSSVLARRRQSPLVPAAAEEPAGAPTENGQPRRVIGAQRDTAPISTSASVRYTLNADSAAVGFVDALYLLLATATTLVAISVVHPLNSNLFGSNDPPRWLLAFIAVVQVLSLFWMATRTVVRTRRGEWEVLDSVEDISKAYLRGWFLFDLFYSFPLEFVAVGSSNRAFYYLLTRHFLRCFRMVTLGRNSNPLVGSRLWFAFLSYCAGVVIALYVVASIFWALEPSETFLTSVYWAAATLTSVGYGDVNVTQQTTRIFAMFSCLCGILLIATLTAFATYVLTSKDMVADELERKKKMLYSMLSYYEIPWHVQQEVISMFPAVLDAQNEASFTSMVAMLPDSVGNKIAHFLRARTLRSMPLFQNLDDESVIANLASELTPYYAAPGEYIVTQGEEGAEMFFLLRGKVDILVWDAECEEDAPVHVLESGAWFGEIALLENCTRTASVVAQVACELLVLEKRHFESHVVQSPELQQRLQLMANKRMSEMHAGGPCTNEQTATDLSSAATCPSLPGSGLPSFLVPFRRSEEQPPGAATEQQGDEELRGLGLPSFARAPRRTDDPAVPPVPDVLGVGSFFSSTGSFPADLGLLAAAAQAHADVAPTPTLTQSGSRTSKSSMESHPVEGRPRSGSDDATE